MAVFSRRPKRADAAPDTTNGTSEGAEADEAPATSTEEPVESVPQVGISLSTYRGGGGEVGRPTTLPDAASVPPAGGAAATGQAAPGAAFSASAPNLPAGSPAGPAESPPQTETVPGLRDNVLLAQALRRLESPAKPEQLLDVMRQLMQNHLFLRIKGDARAMLAEGRELPLAVARRGDDAYVLVYSTGAALQAALMADKDSDTSAVGQPALTILKHVIAGTYAGVIVDGSSAPARAVLPRAVIEAAVNQADPELRIKTALAAPRTPETAAAVASALTEAPLYVAINETGPAVEGEAPRFGIAEARTSDGRRLIEVYSHPLEVIARGRGDRPMPFPPEQLGASLRDHPAVAGVIVDAAGPWIILDREALAPVMALPAPPAGTLAEGSADDSGS
ncbi:MULTISPECIES: SseB family protein [unclassified Microbacterium]|uniref:SseB family protein n=1 Tax=unclassified Microbacterium TaxID=2609290 RepID=UPI0011AF644E|nr:MULTISPECIES: SseB family protein [unclassified Microbacterium]